MLAQPFFLPRGARLHGCAREILVWVTGFTDVEAQCRKAQAAFSILRPRWRSKFISLWTNIKIFDANVKSVRMFDEIEAEQFYWTTQFFCEFDVLLRTFVSQFLDPKR